MRTDYGRRFVATIAVPLLLASIAVAWLTFDLIGRVSTDANTADRERTHEIVQSALDSVLLQLANMMEDNAHWDDAVRHSYGEPDPGWVEETWGVGTAIGTNYDVMMIIDRAMPATVVGYREGSPVRIETGDYFLGKMDALLDLLPKDNTTPASKAAIMETRDGLAVIGVAPILPTSNDLAVPAEMPRYLVLQKFLTPEYVTSIGERYVVKDLAIQDGTGAAEGADVIRDVEGTPIATLAWTDRRPGDGARTSVVPKAVLVLGFLGLVLSVIGSTSWRLVRRIAERENAARHDAFHDSLTGLPNRAALQARVESLAGLGEGSTAIAFADLDGFKEVNDTYDHYTGDRLIKAVAAGFTALVGDNGTVCRLGGDEFVILVHGADADERACVLSQMAIGFLSKSFDLEGRIVTVGASVGIAATRNGEIDAAELMRRADIAMYRAKASGKNRYCRYAPEIDDERNEELLIANELRAILAAGKIDIAYQPIVDARSRSIVAVEALARWPASSPRRITPDSFVAVAETQGLIDDLGDAILAKACADADQWPGLRLSVNISPVQFRNPDFVQRTLKTISASGIDFRRIELEVTEGSLVTDIDVARKIFDELRGVGIHIALDDFGSGFSSIGYLRKFNFDRIKIDRSLVEQMLQGTAEQHIMQGAMLMANGLAATVTAEGVEREDQINLLRLSGCNEMQGYFFFKPMSASDVSKVVAQDPSSTTGPATALA